MICAPEKRNIRRKITLLANGPGELWGWVRPVAAELSGRGWEIALRILPCQFASGEERHIALSLGFPTVLGPESPLRTAAALCSGNERTDAVFQLGGDLLWGRMLAAKSRAPLFCYTYGKKSGLERCTAVFTAYPSMAEAMKLPKGKLGRVYLAGDLVADSLDLPQESVQGTQDAPENACAGQTVAFFPGSRGPIRKQALPFICRTVSSLRERIPDIAARVILSPFTSSGDEEFAFWRSGGFVPVRGGTRSALHGVDLAVTQPGTNTLELMHCAVPFLAVVPFSFLRQVPLSGIAGALAGIPLVGPALREGVLRAKARRRRGFLAWPNRIAGEAVVDEMIGDISPEDVARAAAELLLDRETLARTRKSLAVISASTPRNAAVSVADIIERTLVHT
jgi:lipid-A-disaccharide synthase